jgi:hypothetical protein
MQVQLPKRIQEQLVENHGRDTSKWPQELRDLLDPTIEAVAISAPISGKVAEFINTDYHYHWVEFVDGATPKHDRAQSLRYAGWEFATTDDVKMCSESAVMGRKGDKKSKDGRMGFSDDIRSGDRRLMKLPMALWRKTKKAQNLAAFQMAYPTAFGGGGGIDADGMPIPPKPMSAASLIPGLKSEMLDPAAIDDARRHPGNSVTTSVVKREG